MQHEHKRLNQTRIRIQNPKYYWIGTRIIIIELGTVYFTVVDQEPTSPLRFGIVVLPGGAWFLPIRVPSNRKGGQRKTNCFSYYEISYQYNLNVCNLFMVPYKWATLLSHDTCQCHPHSLCIGQAWHGL